jgi:hypothetical protein
MSASAIAQRTMDERAARSLLGYLSRRGCDRLRVEQWDETGDRYAVIGWRPGIGHVILTGWAEASRMTGGFR